MPKKSQNRENSKVTVRLSKEERALLEALAAEQNISLSDFLRQAMMSSAEMYVENKELLEQVGKNNADKVQKTIHEKIESIKELLANSIQQSNEDLSSRISQVERLLESFLYAYLFHTPEVAGTLKKEAKRSAESRMRKVKAWAEN